MPNEIILLDSGQDAGGQTVLPLLRTSLQNGEVKKQGISIMEDIFLDGVEWQLEAGV